MNNLGRPREYNLEQIEPLFDEYVKHTKENPYIVIDYVGKDGDAVERRKEKPLTIEGFKSFCHDKTGHSFHPYWINLNGAYDDFLPIITRIKETIRREQLEGGMAGMYNSNLTARINGLTDKQEVDNKHSGQLEVKNITLDLT